MRTRLSIARSLTVFVVLVGLLPACAPGRTVVASQTPSAPATTATDAASVANEPSEAATELAAQTLRGRSGYEAYRTLRSAGFRVRFAANITRPQRLNIKGVLTHPAVVVTGLRSEPRQRIVTITRVACTGRDVCP